MFLFSAQVSSGQAPFAVLWVWSRRDADIQIFRKTNHLLKTQASTMQHDLPSVHTLLLPSFYFLSFSRRWNSLRTQCSLPHLLIFSKSSFCNSVSSSRFPKISVDLLHLPNDLLLEDRQDGVIVTHLLEHDPAVKLVAHFLEVEPVHTTHRGIWLFQSQIMWKMNILDHYMFQKHKHQMFSPVMALFGKKLLELAQSHHPAFDWCSVWDWLSTEVVGDGHVLTHLALTRLMP